MAPILAPPRRDGEDRTAPTGGSLGRGAAALDVRRSTVAARDREGGGDPAGREVGAALAHLLERGERRVLDLAPLQDHRVEEGRVVLAAVEDQAHGVVPAAPRR